MELKELYHQITANHFKPVYFLYGEEPYYIDNLVKAFISNVVPEESRDFNCDILQAEETEGAGVVALASSFPMMSERRLVVVKSIQKFTSADTKQLSAYIDSPSDNTVLVLTAGAKIDRRKSLYAMLTKKYPWFESKRLYENQAAGWVRNHLEKQGVHLSTDAATLFVQQVGTSLWNLYNECEKLITYTWGNARPGLKEVNDIVGVSRKYNTWELADAVGQKDIRTALTVLKGLMEDGASAVGLIILLAQRMFLLQKIRSLIDARVSESKIQKQMRLTPFFLKMYMKQGRHFNHKELASAISTLTFADYQIKTGMLNPYTAITMLVYQLIRGDAANPFEIAA